MGDMSLSALRTSLKEALMDSAAKFTADEELDRCLDVALVELGRVKPKVIRASIELVADQVGYDCPEGLRKPLLLEWGADVLRTIKPWDSNWPGRLPNISVGHEGDVRKILLLPAPTAAQIKTLGATARYRYTGPYALGETAAGTTVTVDDRELLLTRALAEAMFMLARKDVAKPVMVGKPGVGGMPKNGMPASLAGEFIKQFNTMAGLG